MPLVYLSLGSNLGNKMQKMQAAISRLSNEAGRLLKQSDFHTTKAWGFKSENDFLNAVVLIETTLSPFELLAKTQEIERDLGRVNKTEGAYSDRLIDIDILLYDNLIVDEPTLKIPHPLMTERDFVMIPLLEIAPQIIHPLSKIEFRKLAGKRN
jgi:2-amino-4-hydroxy-6-hydroxymethyldihydropteridine diphosphokinase